MRNIVLIKDRSQRPETKHKPALHYYGSLAVMLCCTNQYVFLYSFGPPVGATEAESAEESYAFGLE